MQIYIYEGPRDNGVRRPHAGVERDHPMTGITMAGVRVEGPRRKAPRAVAHPLGSATPAEARATVITTLRAAGKTMGEIAVIMRCSSRTLNTDLATPPVAIGRGDSDAA